MYKLLKRTTGDAKTDNYVTVETYQTGKNYFTIAFVNKNIPKGLLSQSIAFGEYAQLDINPKDILAYEESEKENIAMTTHSFFCQMIPDLSFDENFNIVRKDKKSFYNKDFLSFIMDNLKASLEKKNKSKKTYVIEKSFIKSCFRLTEEQERFLFSLSAEGILNYVREFDEEIDFINP